MGRILAIDYGHKRIGLALSDEGQVLASPFQVIQRQADLPAATLWTKLREISQQQQVEAIVVGLPVSLSGEEGRAAEKIRHFATELRDQLQLPVILVDESFTTYEAEQVLIANNTSRSKRKEKIDAVAATILLQQHLDQLNAKS